MILMNSKALCIYSCEHNISSDKWVSSDTELLLLKQNQKIPLHDGQPISSEISKILFLVIRKTLAKLMNSELVYT